MNRHASFRYMPLLFAAALTAGCSSPEPGTAEPAGTPVRSALVGTGPAVAAIEANGLVGSRDEMKLSFKTGGIVRRIAVQEGETVGKGDVLA